MVKGSKGLENVSEGYSAFYKKSMIRAHQILQKVYGKDRVGFIENYVRHQFIFEDEQAGLSYLRKSFSASKSPLRERIYRGDLQGALD